MAIDAVLPVLARDLPRARLLARSLDRFFPELGTCWVVTPADSIEAVQAAFPESPYRVVAEDDLVPELGGGLVGPRRAALGWFFQQLIKLAIVDAVESDFYLTLDSDVICTRPTTVDDLVRDGRAICEGRPSPEQHLEWYQWAERVLGVESRRTQHGVTPALLSRPGVLKLTEHVAQRAAQNGRDETWRGHLLRNMPWTEYALYTTYLEHADLYDRYHLRLGKYAVYGNCVWSPDQYEGWDPAASFDPEATFHFTVVQSTVGIPAADLLARVEPFLDGARLA